MKNYQLEFPPVSASRGVRRRLVGCILIIAASASPRGTSGHVKAKEDADLVAVLLNQGLSPAQVLGTDANGIPLVCATTGVDLGTPGAEPKARADDLTADTRAWESTPGVIRNDGLDTFRLQVNANGEVTRVTLDNISHYLVPPETPPFDLRDDGQNGDRIAGDHVFTSGMFRYDTAVSMPQFYWNDSSSPTGLYNTGVGTLTIEELDGTETTFLNNPAIGLLRFDIDKVDSFLLSPDILVSSHLINMRTGERETQRYLRFLGGDLRNLTNRIYEVLPDAVAFFVFISVDKVERLPRLSNANFNAGVHSQVRTNFSGTGLGLYDATATYGSGGVLWGVNVIDAYGRGAYSGNITHEILHQWVSFTGPSLGLSEGAHYKPRCSVGSLIGGFRWVDNGDGTFSRNCTEGRNGAHRAPPLDLYMMGLIDGDVVAPLYVSDPEGALDCGEVVDDPYLTVTVEDIHSVHGVRAPGPTDTQRDFTVAFVVETHDRLLNTAEMTFYEILAEHYTKPVPPEQLDPYVGFNWASIDRFFGEGTTWSTAIRVFHDADRDHDVDLGDFAAFGTCFSGPTGTFRPGCEIVDGDADRDLDLADFQLLQISFTGPASRP